MSNISRGIKAQNLLLNEHGVDYILECHETPDYVQCVCSMRGDIITYRVYNNGTVVEK